MTVVKSSDREQSVFVNCPFDKEYRPLFQALLWTILFCGFNVRCALDENSSGDVRLNKIISMIRASALSVHDLSRVQPDRKSGLPRFNMPLELGATIGLHHDGEKVAGHYPLILDSEQSRYQKYVSDLSGVDIKSHGGTSKGVVVQVSEFLAHKVDRHLPSPTIINNGLRSFRAVLPDLARAERQTVRELRYIDILRHMAAYLAAAR